MTGSVYGSSEVALGASHDPSTSGRRPQRPCARDDKKQRWPPEGCRYESDEAGQNPGPRHTREAVYVGRVPLATTISSGKAVCLPSQYLRRPARISATAM